MLIRRRTGVRLVLALLAGLILAGTLTVTTPAAAQTQDLTAAIESVTTSVGPDTEAVQVSGKLTNSGKAVLTDVRASLWIAESPITDRAGLSAAAAADSASVPGTRIAADPDFVDDIADTLQPGDSAEFSVRVPVEHLREVYGRTEPGVYLLGVDLRGDIEGGLFRDTWTVRTFVPWFTDEKKDLTPVEVAFILPLVAPPALVDSDTVLDDRAAEVFQPDGRLSTLLDLGVEADLTYLVDPALLDLARTMADRHEVAMGRDGQLLRAGSQDAADFLDRAEGILAGQETYLLPYGDPDLPALVENELADRLGSAVEASRTAADELNALPEPLTWPGPGFADGQMLEVVAENGGSTVLLRAGAVPEAPTDGTAPVISIPTPAGALTALVSDPRLTGHGPDRDWSVLQTRQRFLSETALLAMLPADEDTLRRVVAAFGRRFEPGSRPGSVLALVDDVPWLRRISTGALLSQPPVAYGGKLRAPSDTSGLDKNVVAELRQFAAESATYLDLLADPEAERDGLAEEFLRGSSIAWRQEPNRGLELNRVGARNLNERIDGGVDLIASKVVTLSDASGRFPITIQNRLDTAVRVNLEVTAADRSMVQFDPIEPVVVAPGRKETVSITANADAGGAVEVEARARTVDTDVALGPTTVFQVRVTGYGQIGWAVIGVGIGLLLLVVAARIVRRVRGRKARATSNDGPGSGGADPDDPGAANPTHPANPATPAEPVDLDDSDGGDNPTPAADRIGTGGEPDAGSAIDVDPGARMVGRSGLLGSSAVMAAGTMVSRITGFVRNLVLVWALSSGLFADTFNLANTIPTTIYILVAGGALNAVFVPQLVRAMKNDSDGGEAFGGRLFTAAALLLAGVTAVVVLAAPLLIQLFASGSLMEPDRREYYDLAVTFARYCLPQIFFMGMFVILGQILNARGNFGPMMWAPIVNNLVNIGVFVGYVIATAPDSPQSPAEITPGQEALLGLGTTAGVALQALLLVPVLRRVGFRLRPRFDLRRTGLGKTARLAIWTVGFVIVNQVWFWLAAKLTTGVSAQAEELFGSDAGFGLTPYLSAFLIFMLPHAVITVSLVTALLPRLSAAAADGDRAAVGGDLREGLSVVAVAMLPATAAFLALGPVLAMAMYDHGTMSPDNARFIGYVLMGFAPGLLGFCSHYTVLRGFYAFEDTRTPAIIQLTVLGTSSACAIIAYSVLPVQWKTVGIAVSYGIGYWVGFAVSRTVLSRKIGPFGGRRLVATYLRAGSAAAISGVIAFGLARLVLGPLGDGAWSALIASAVGGVGLIVGYLILGRLFGVSELGQLFGLVRRRLRGRAG